MNLIIYQAYGNLYAMTGKHDCVERIPSDNSLHTTLPPNMVDPLLRFDNWLRYTLLIDRIRLLRWEDVDVEDGSSARVHQRWKAEEEKLAGSAWDYIQPLSRGGDNEELSSAKKQHVWHLPEDEYDEFSVMIPKEDVVFKGASVVEVLKGIPKGHFRKMRKKLIEMIPRIVYRRRGSSLGLRNQEDAFDIAVEGTIRRIKARLESLGDM
nr:probable xyloglucan galactosyltransferase GT19 [Tanacetum cinerariifolium]